MDRHLSTEQLSSYLDGEIGSREAQVLEDHIASCEACHATLLALRRVVAGVRRLERPAPPASLAFRVRRGVAAANEPRSLVQRLQLLLSDLSFHPRLRASAAMGLAILFSLLLVSPEMDWKSNRDQPAEPQRFVVTVTTYPELPPLPLPQTTSEVAGREFVYARGRWVQRGFEDERPVTRVAAGSEQGRAMLSKYSDLGFLLADGSRVVLMYRMSTVELSGS